MKRIIILFMAAVLLAASGVALAFAEAAAQATQPAAQPESEKPPDAQVCTHGEDTFCTHLPLVAINTLGNQIDRYLPVWCEVTVVDNESAMNHADDAPALQTASTIHYRGQSSAAFPKKQYRMELYEKQGGEKKRGAAVMGMAEECDWVLNGPYLDRTMMRNALMYEIARQTMAWAPDTRFCEVMVDGRYQGIYLMIESIKISENRIELSDFALRDGTTPYLLYRDRASKDENFIDTYAVYMGRLSNPVSIRYPNEKEITAAQQRYISQDINAFERLLYSERFDDAEEGFMSLIDVDSFATYFVLNEFSMNTDMGYLSTYCHKDLTGKLVMGPVWDFNNAFNHYVSDSMSSNWRDVNSFTTIHNAWFERMLQCEAFVDAVVEKYYVLRAGVLSDSALLAYIDETATHLGDSVNRNFEVWTSAFQSSMLGDDPKGNSRRLHSYQEALDQLKGCVVEHGAFLDANIESLYLLAQPQRQSHIR